MGGNRCGAGFFYVGQDDRDWQVFQLSPQVRVMGEEVTPGKTFTIRLQHKTVELVQQEEEMRVYVNPDPQGPDEWEVGGVRFEMGGAIQPAS